jgi:protein-serine/threonine kinase
MSISKMQTTTSSSESFGVPMIEKDPREKYVGWEKIGEGGTGEVFSCFDFDGKRVAIKVTANSDESYIETQIWSHIPKSDHIVNLIEIYVWGNYVYAVMELMQSILTDIIPTPRKHMPFLPTVMLLRIIHDLILAVNHLHENFISHGDLKSDNVLLDASGKVKLADFGVATQHGEIHPNTPLCGTSQWKPPNAMKKETASPLHP